MKRLRDVTPTVVAAVVTLAGAALLGGALWSGLGWEFAAAVWGGALLVLGLDELLDRSDGGGGSEQ